MGLLREGINEVIATTKGNAAPMGIILRGDRYTMIAFHGSHTAENISRYGWIVANIVYDPVMYVRTAFSDLDSECFCEENAGEFAVQRLSGAEGWIAFQADIARDTGESLAVALTPLREEVCFHAVHPINRVFRV